LPELENAPVAIRSSDNRSSNRDRVSSKKNGYGIETAAISSAVPPPQVVADAFEKELRAQGYKIAAGGATATIELTKFYSDFKNGFFSGDVVGEVSFTISVRAADNRLLFSKSYDGIGMVRDIMLATGPNAKLALDEALANAMQKAVGDQEFRTILIKEGRTTSKPTS
jgi:uncharacterized lipoprotein